MRSAAPRKAAATWQRPIAYNENDHSTKMATFGQAASGTLQADARQVAGVPAFNEPPAAVCGGLRQARPDTGVGSNRGGCILIKICDHDLCAFASKRSRDSFADPARTTSNHRNLYPSGAWGAPSHLVVGNQAK
jgi:hypothetical protein